jgi:glycosyltransferase involved in cell wall biosynthesis
MRVAVCHPQTPFVRGGAETHAERLVTALREAGHDAELVLIAGKWYPGSELAHQMAVWRALDLSESNGLPIDVVIAMKFPAYLMRHERKIVWLIHQHRTAYELWDHPQYADLARQPEGALVRDLIHSADRVALGEAKRVFANSRNVARRLQESLGIASEPLYHRSPITDALLRLEPGEHGDTIVFPSRFESLKRQSIVVDAMRHVRSKVKLLLVGQGPDEPALRRQIEDGGLGDRVAIEVGPPDERLMDLVRSALGVYYGPFDEDFGYVTLEAFAAERPVVTLADSGGPLEFVTDGGTGFVAEPESKAIADALDRLFADRAAARRMGAAGREVLEREVPAWPEVVARLLG